MEQIANNSIMENVFIFLQMIAIVCWFVFLTKLDDKKKYLCSFHYWLLNILSGGMIYTLLKELVDNGFNLEWNLWTWYPINLLLVLVMFIFIEKIEKLKDDLDETSRQDKNL